MASGADAAMPPLSDKERELLIRLNDQGIRFMIVGMSAAILQGAPMATADVDLWVENLSDPRFAQILQDLGGAFVPTLPHTLNNPMIVGDEFKLYDLVIGPIGLESFEEEYRMATTIDLGGVTVKVLDIDSVIKSKQAAGREKDQIVLPALRAVSAVVHHKKNRS